MKNCLLTIICLTVSTTSIAQSRLIDLLRSQGLQSEDYCLYHRLDTVHLDPFLRYPTMGKPGFPKDKSNTNKVPSRKFEIWYAPYKNEVFKETASGLISGFDYSIPFVYSHGFYATLFPKISAILIINYEPSNTIAELYYHCTKIPDE